MISLQEFSQLIEIEIDPNLSFPALTEASKVIKVDWDTLNTFVPKTTLEEELKKLKEQTGFRYLSGTIIYIKKFDKKPSIIIRNQEPKDLAYYKLLSFHTTDIKLLKKLFKVYNMKAFV